MPSASKRTTPADGPTSMGETQTLFRGIGRRARAGTTSDSSVATTTTFDTTKRANAPAKITSKGRRNRPRGIRRSEDGNALTHRTHPKGEAAKTSGVKTWDSPSWAERPCSPQEGEDSRAYKEKARDRPPATEEKGGPRQRKEGHPRGIPKTQKKHSPSPPKNKKHSTKKPKEKRTGRRDGK